MTITGLFYSYHSRKKEIFHEKILMYGFASFWLTIALIRTFFYFSDYYLEGTYTGDLSIIIQTYDTGKYILLYFYLYLFAYVLISIIFLSIMFIWLSLKSIKEFQIISSVVTIGLVMILIGWVFETIKIKELNLIYPAIPSGFIIIGAIITIFPLIIDLEFFSNRFANWLILISIASILAFLSLTLFTNFSLNIISQILIWISAILLIVAIFYIIVNITKRNRVSQTATPMDKEGFPDFIKAFIKPSTITIEEIESYRKRGLCLVCKSKVSRLSYICPKCNAIYCIKCSEALTNLENACWVCDTSFDGSIPLNGNK
ncbi:MAG: hypothetical protein JSV62_10030 [Promethearchaeota archaeon]|nr:MAG: hypothetical protein JSV62_10030 [Candidatus Lokiarchaeota archaeon]